MPGACVPSGLPVALQAPELFDLDNAWVPKDDAGAGGGRRAAHGGGAAG